MVSAYSPSRRSGFSLIVVLSSLLVLTLIFGISSAQLVGHVQRDAATKQLASKHHETSQKVLAVLAAGQDVNTLDIAALNGLSLQPASGLVDLNTSSPVLLRLLLDGYGLSASEISDAMERYQNWRQDGRKLHRVSDFPNIVGLEASRLPNLELLTTVYSGRTGLDVAQIPSNLAWHLLGTDPAGAAETLDPNLIGTGSSVNLHVLDAGKLLGVVHIGGEIQLNRLLQLN